ncbi:MAG: sigma-70 family RNA polymerase sigma factor [Bacteroidaceae bacterium]|nr:sigma-70 family RNA polymerase sigma factor [Bacteroidaceae bacterium]MDE5999683.1 sigma-70 family RNA polymerase sigma factor [Bacteroidaceae bacterium]MDE6721820.1 sigma-70 family RNA polymerase sigma factor [Bacteroidaceae bacterium]
MKKLHELADEELVSLYIKGNNNAFDALLKRYESKVFSYLLYSVKNQELAEDLFQDVFVKMIVRLKNGQYAENGKFSSWMMRIVHNHLIDYYRTSVADKTLSNDATEADLYSKADIALNENREQEMIDQQTLKEVRGLIALLPESQREVLLMRVYDELSFKEIAQKTNCSINTALGRMRYAILNLRHMAFERGISMAS